MQHIHPGQSQALYGVAATRIIEGQAQARLPQHALMQRAGLAISKLTMAVAPHAQHIWIACGSGNNGGDGLEAAINLHQSGKQTTLTWLGKPDIAPSDAAKSYLRAISAGVKFTEEPPNRFDLCIDSLLGIGTKLREPDGTLAIWIQQMNGGTAPVLSVDLPTGLDANTGAATQLHVHATHTLGLLTLKPGMFTAQGRQACGQIWFDALLTTQNQAQPTLPDAMLAAQPTFTPRSHTSHKGIFGDVAVIGGAPGMTGAALLAASAALYGGAGRVFVALLDGHSQNVDVNRPELMFRPFDALDLDAMAVVCGCGGGVAVQTVLAQVLSSNADVVIDADAINSISLNEELKILLANRVKRSAATVLTPHPLEAARLLNCSATQVQEDRLAAVNRLVQRFACTVVLKGSGTLVASPGEIPFINPTGNAKLATAGTGDVLAGMVGAGLAMKKTPFTAAWHAVYQHGWLADHWPERQPLVASELAKQFGG